MICAHCSAEMPDISSYCPACGEAVPSAAESFAAAGLGERILAALAYLPLLPAILLLLIPATRRSAFIRFHAWQGVFFAALGISVALVLRVIFLMFQFLGSFGFLLAWLLVGVSAIAFTIAWLMLVVKAILGQSYEIPFIGAVADRLAINGPFATNT